MIGGAGRADHQLRLLDRTGPAPIRRAEEGNRPCNYEG